jgi:hypothetical protein
MNENEEATIMMVADQSIPIPCVYRTSNAIASISFAIAGVDQPTRTGENPT